MIKIGIHGFELINRYDRLIDDGQMDGQANERGQTALSCSQILIDKCEGGGRVGKSSFCSHHSERLVHAEIINRF